MEEKKKLNMEELNQIAGGDTDEGLEWIYVVNKAKCNGCGKRVSI